MIITVSGAVRRKGQPSLFIPANDDALRASG
jgi:hypothetical protein